MKNSLWLLVLISGLCFLNACGGGSSAQTAVVTVSVQPPSATVLLQAGQPFMAVVTGTANTAVTWSVKEGPAGGSIDTQGNYTAPQVAGTYHVIATSVADPSQSGSATITVPVAVSVGPNPATVFLGAKQAFMATVAGTNNMAVTWAVQEGAAGGSIDAQGNYTAPNVVGTYHVVATSVVDKTQSATATVNVPPISVTVSPNPATVFLSSMQAFMVTVTSANPAVTWAVQEGAAGGSVTNAGVYTAPNVVGTYHVIATSVADNTKSDTAVVTVPPVAVSVSPATDTLGPHGLRIFTAAVTGTNNSAVNWSIQEGAVGGTIDANGDYTAPAGQGTFHILATSVADPAKNSTATVTVVASGFLPAGNMTAARANHTATLLNTGEALVVGGVNHYRLVIFLGSPHCFPVQTTAADLFDPGMGTFTATGAMSASRSGHTATVLQDNTVLVAGGTTFLSPIATAEIYNPATGAFTGTGMMTMPRTNHTATLLPSGKVLIAGGAGGGATAELLDPAMGSFAATGSMADMRTSHTATLLPSGKVLVAGGVGSNGTSDTAELYDPTGAGTFTATGSLTTPRTNHTATFIPSTGMVLIAGGRDQSGAPLASAELYNPMTGTFTATGSMAASHSAHSATLLSSGKVLIAGGGNFVAELYDPAAGTFTLTGSMFTSRNFFAATALPTGDVLVTGTRTPVHLSNGSCIGGAANSAEIYK